MCDTSLERRGVKRARQEYLDLSSELMMRRSCLYATLSSMIECIAKVPIIVDGSTDRQEIVARDKCVSGL
jgi:hypothetical protein